MRLSYFHTKQRLWLLCGGIILCLSLAIAPSLLPAGANPGVEVAIIDAPAEVDPDSDFVAKVSITQGIVTDLDVAQFDITYDQAVLHVTSVVGGEIGGKAVQLDTWGYIPASTEDTGRIRVICNQPMPTPENTDPWLDGYGYLVKLHFDVVGNAGSSTTISFPEGATLLLGDKDANPIPVDEWVNSGTVEVDNESGCFIATAAFGTPAAEEIDILRKFRDEVMMPNRVGAELVSLYYRVSPSVADFISRHEVLRTIVREGFVQPLVVIVRCSQSL